MWDEGSGESLGALWWETWAPGLQITDMIICSHPGFLAAGGEDEFKHGSNITVST